MDGQIGPEHLPRLSQAVKRLETPVSASLHFSRDPSGYRQVTGPLSVRVSMVCQRCMGEKELEINSELAVGVVINDEQAKSLPRSLEPWLVDREEAEADLYSVVEDELLLDLPMVVYHDYQCIDEELYSSGEASAEATREEGNRSPFQVLEQLKDKGNKK